ncbi:hypothetical protein [Algoriphagus chordae]|nr:hypothetical protein [Algoriphagus chordae]
MKGVRVAYYEAGQDDAKIEAFYALVENVTKEDSPVMVGYKGAALALNSKIETGIKNKVDSFKKGVEFIEHAVKTDPEAIEIRFIRLSVQENSPGVMKYKNEIEEDKTFLLENFEHIASESLKQYIGDYIMQSNAFTEAEKESLKF